MQIEKPAPLGRRRSPVISVMLMASTLATLLAMVGSISDVAAAMVGEDSRAVVRIEGDLGFEARGLMPGDRLPVATVTITAPAETTYRLGVALDGSEALAKQLSVRITDRATGEAVYEGPLNDPRLGAEHPLEAGDQLELRIESELALSAGNEVQGAVLVGSWTVSATPAAAP